MKSIIIAFVLTLGWLGIQAQVKFTTRNGQATIFSHTPAEDIKASNNQVTGTINAESGDLVFSIPVQSFEFEKALMQKHFNQPNFMDSKTYPRIKFVGKIQNLSEINFKKDGVYSVIVTGDLTIRDVTKSISEKGTIEVKEGKIHANSKFIVKGISDYKVGKPKGGKKNNVAEDIEVTYHGVYETE
jgi:polyisoprenoid-binding protein YceI